MTTSETEFEALRKLSSADRHYRVFVYVLTILTVMLSALYINYAISHKIDTVIEKAGVQAAAQAAIRNKEQQTIAKETMRYTTCIFVIPVDERTPDVQQKCFNQADLPGGLDRSDFSPYVPSSPDDPNVISATQGAAQPSVGQQSVASQPSGNENAASPQGITVTPTTQPDTPQQPNTQTNLLQPAINGVQDVLRVLTGP